MALSLKKKKSLYTASLSSTPFIAVRLKTYKALRADRLERTEFSQKTLDDSIRSRMLDQCEKNKMLK